MFLEPPTVTKNIADERSETYKKTDNLQTNYLNLPRKKKARRGKTKSKLSNHILWEHNNKKFFTLLYKNDLYYFKI